MEDSHQKSKNRVDAQVKLNTFTSAINQILSSDTTSSNTNTSAMNINNPSGDYNMHGLNPQMASYQQHMVSRHHSNKSVIDAPQVSNLRAAGIDESYLMMQNHGNSSLGQNNNSKFDYMANQMNIPANKIHGQVPNRQVTPPMTVNQMMPINLQQQQQLLIQNMSPKMIDGYRRNFSSQKPTQIPPDYLPDGSPNYIHREQMHMQPQQIQHMLQYQQQQSMPYNQNLQYPNLMANQRSNSQQSALLSTDSLNQHHQQQSQNQLSNVSPGMMSNISHNAFSQNQKALTQQQHNYLNSMATNSISTNSPRASPIVSGSNISGVIDNGQKGMINQLTSQQQANIDAGNPLLYHINQGKHFDMNIASNRYRIPVPPQQQQQYHHQQSRNSPLTNPRFLHSPHSNINNQTRNSHQNSNQYLAPQSVPNNMMGMNQHHSYSSNLLPGDFPSNPGQIPNQGVFSDLTSGENTHNNSQGKTKRTIQLQHCDANTQRLCFPLRQGSVLAPFNLLHDTNQISKSFDLCEQIYEELMWRDDVELQFKCFHHEDKFMRVSWPSGIRITVNGSPVPVDEPTPNNMMPASLPLFLKGVCHKGLNTIDVYVQHCACSHLLYLQIVHRPTILQIMEKIYHSRHVNDSNYWKRSPCLFDSQNHANHSPNSSISKANMNRNGNLEVFDIKGNVHVISNPANKVESIIISRDCPISKKLIRIPVRGIHCNHLQCFDLESYLYLNLVRSLWRCPICFSNTIIEKLEVDDFIMQINTLSEAYGCSKIEVRSDSKWRPIADSTHSPNVTNNGSYPSNVMIDANYSGNNINQNRGGDIDSYNHKQILSSTLSNLNSNVIHSDNSTLPSSQEILDVNKNSPALQNDGDAQSKNNSDQVNLDNFNCHDPNESNVLLKSISGLSSNTTHKNLDDRFELQGSVVSNSETQADLNSRELMDARNKCSNTENNLFVDTRKDGIGSGLDEKLGPDHLTELAASDAKHFKLKEDIDQFDETNVELECNIDTSKEDDDDDDDDDDDYNIANEESNVNEWNYQHLENLMLTNTLTQSPTQNSPAMNNALNSIKLDADDPIESLLMKNTSKHINADINMPESNINKSNDPLTNNCFDIIGKVKKPLDITGTPEPDSPHDASQIIPVIDNTMNCDESTELPKRADSKDNQISSNIASGNTNNVYLIPQNHENQDLKGDQILVNDFSNNSMGMYDLNKTNDMKIISPEQEYLCNFINDTHKSDPGELLDEEYKKTNINTNETTLGNIVGSNSDSKHCDQFLNDEYPLNSPDNDFNNFIM